MAFLKNVWPLFLLLVFTACRKDAPVPTGDTSPNGTLSIVPAISLMSAQPSSIKQFTDSIVFTVHYTDGDGDIGYAEADSLSLFLTDNRGPFTEGYHIQPLAPVGVKIAISGNLRVVLNHTMLLDTSSTSENTTYSVYLKDRAGNVSNTITTGTLLITQ